MAPAGMGSFGNLLSLPDSDERRIGSRLMVAELTGDGALSAAPPTDSGAPANY